MERLIFHVDVNSAFLSWEAARRMSAGGADLRLVPSAIGGDREKRTGVVLAKSIPAAACGVQTGEPIAMALRKCPQLVLVRPDFQWYRICSRRLVALCRRFAPVVEPFSIDECFLDLSGTASLYPEPEAVASLFKALVRERLGFTVNIGISSNKLLAKMASDFEKPDRVHTLWPSEVADKLWPLPVRRLFLVGRSTAARLEQASIRTIGDLARLEAADARALLGQKTGDLLHRYANGTDDTPVRPMVRAAKGYSQSVTLDTDIVRLEQALPVLLSLTDRVTARMRADGVKAGCISVTCRSSDFRDRSRQLKLKQPTDVTAEVYQTVRRLFVESWDGRTPLRLLGVALTDIDRTTYEQTSFFDDGKRTRSREMDQVVDLIRRRFGRGAVVRGGMLKPPPSGSEPPSGSKINR